MTRHNLTALDTPVKGGVEAEIRRSRETGQNVLEKLEWAILTLKRLVRMLRKTTTQMHLWPLENPKK